MPLFKNVRPCTFLNYEFFYRKTRFYLETLTSCQQQRCFLLKNLSSTDVQGCTFFIRDGSHYLCELSVPPRRAVVPRNSDTQAQIVVAVVRVVVVPIGTSGVIRIILPAATAFDAVRTGISTFFCPYRLIHYTINDLIIHFAICLPVVFLFCFLLYGRVPLQQSKSMQRLHRLNKYNVQWSTS